MWWVSLALSCSLNLHHSPCGFLYNHLYCLLMTPLQVRYFVMAGDFGDEHGSKSIRYQKASCHARVLRMLSIFTVSSYFLSSNVHSGPIYPNFRTFSMIFRDFSQYSLSENLTSFKFPFPNIIFLMPNRNF